MEQKRGPGRPKKEGAKVAVSLRLSPDVLDDLKALGPGWQAITDGMLREALLRHRTAVVPMPKLPVRAKIAFQPEADDFEPATTAVPAEAPKPFWSNLKKR